MTRARGAHSRDSFTLVEMLVAIAILGIILIVLLGMTTSIMNTWQFGQARNERRTAGQAILDRISRDLRQAALPASRSNTNSLQLVINPTGVSTAYEYPQAIFWQAPVPTDEGISGNLAVVGYFVQWVSGVPMLSRILINPSSTGSYLVYSTPAAWISDSILATNAAGTAASGYSGLMAENVLGLWVQALDPQGRPIKQRPTDHAGENFDSRLSYTYTNSVYPSVLSTNIAPVLPASIQVAILVVDSRTAKRLTGTEKPTTASLTGNFWTDINTFYSSLPPVVQKGSEIQTITVDLASGPR
jgi:prepilin-type N-terminal cleavage/methylation domain-containing protein